MLPFLYMEFINEPNGWQQLALNRCVNSIRCRFKCAMTYNRDADQLKDFSIT